MSGFIGSLLTSLSANPASLVAGGLNLVGNLVGGSMAADANEDAANRVVADNAEARAELAAAKERGIGYINQGTQDYASTIAPLMTERPILLPTYRGLTMQQQMGRADLQRTGQAALASSGLRGAGRAGIGSYLDTMGRYNAAARDATDSANRIARQTARSGADAARTGLATVQANAGTAKANTEIGVGSQNAGNLQNQGNTLGNLTVAGGNTQADLATSIGKLAGNTLMSGAGYAAGNSPNQPQAFYPPYGPQQPRQNDNEPKV